MNIISWTFAYFIFFLSIKFEIILDLHESPKDSARGPVHPSPSFPQCEQFPFFVSLVKMDSPLSYFHQVFWSTRPLTKLENCPIVLLISDIPSLKRNFTWTVVSWSHSAWPWRSGNSGQKQRAGQGGALGRWDFQGPAAWLARGSRCERCLQMNPHEDI